MYQIDNASAAAELPAPDGAGTPGFFTGGDPLTGVEPTELPADFMNMLMLELLNLLEAAGIEPSKTEYDQVLAAIRSLTASSAASHTLPGIVALATDAEATAGTDDSKAVTPHGLAAARVAFTASLADVIAGIATTKFLTPATAAAAAQEGSFLFAVDTSGAANVVSAALAPAITAYTAGMVVRIKIANSATGAATLELNGLGPKPIQWNGRALVGPELVGGQTITAIYDGAAFQILGLACISGGADTAWWRIYADGEIEQGGYVAGAFTEGTQTIALPIPFPAAYRGVVGTAYNSAVSTSSDYWLKGQTIPGAGVFATIDVYINSGTGGAAITGFSWGARGR